MSWDPAYPVVSDALRNLLVRAGIKSLAEAIAMKDDDLLQCRMVGPLTIQRIREAATELDMTPENAVDALHARIAALEAVRAAGDEVAHRLQMWVKYTPGCPGCYSEAALAEYRAATAALDGEGAGSS